MKVRFGILGAGKILGKIGTAFRLTDRAELVAIASRDLSRAETAAKTYGAKRAVAGYETLLADPEVEVIFNALHTGLHCEWTCRALEAGKHVLCEKPLACSSSEVNKMFAVAHANRRWLMEGFMYRFQPQTVEAKKRVDAGEIGRALHIRANYATQGRELGNPRYWREAGGGALMDVGCYCVNAARLFAGGEPNRVLAQARFHNGVDMTLAGTLEFAGTITAHILCSFESEGVFGIEVNGTDGNLFIPNPWLPASNYGEIILTRDGKVETIRIPTPHQFSHFAGEIEHFCECIRENRAPSVVTEADSRGNMQVMEALLASARDGV